MEKLLRPRVDETTRTSTKAQEISRDSSNPPPVRVELDFLPAGGRTRNSLSVESVDIDLAADPCGDLLQAFADLFSAGIFIVDAKLDLKLANRSGREMLDAGEHFFLSDGSLSTPASVEKSRLSKAVATVCGGPLDRQALLFHGGGGKRALQMVVNRLGACDSEEAWAVLVAEHLHPPSPDLLPARLMFDLTQRETQTLEDLASGLTAEESARRRKVALSTVRTHLSSLLAKTGVENQVQLMQSLRSLPSLRQGASTGAVAASAVHG